MSIATDCNEIADIMEQWGKKQGRLWTGDDRKLPYKFGSVCVIGGLYVVANNGVRPRFDRRWLNRNETAQAILAEVGISILPIWPTITFYSDTHNTNEVIAMLRRVADAHPDTVPVQTDYDLAAGGTD